MKTLLLQVRDHAEAEAQEAACFSDALAGRGRELATYNLVQRPRIGWPDVASADLLLLGGAGQHSVTHDYAFTPYLEDVLRRWIEAERRFFGSCYGHHVLAKLYGARVIEDPECEEVGTFDVSLTEHGEADPVFGDLPGTFPAQLGHHDRVADLPDSLLELARSERCDHQALRVRGLPAYSTQFHPEISEPMMRERLMMYRDGYLGPEVEWDDLLGSLRPTPDAARLLRLFLDAYS